MFANIAMIVLKKSTIIDVLALFMFVSTGLNFLYELKLIIILTLYEQKIERKIQGISSLFL
jgi:hypothetical protein